MGTLGHLKESRPPSLPSASPDPAVLSACPLLCSGSGLCCMSDQLFVTLSSRFLSILAAILLLPHPLLCVPPVWGMTLSPSAKGPLSFWLGLTLPKRPPSPPCSPPLSGPLQREDTAELGVRLGSALVDHGRNSDLSDIQEEEEAEAEELGVRTCSFPKQGAGNSLRDNGAKVTG